MKINLLILMFASLLNLSECQAFQHCCCFLTAWTQTQTAGGWKIFLFQYFFTKEHERIKEHFHLYKWVMLMFVGCLFNYLLVSNLGKLQCWWKKLDKQIIFISNHYPLMCCFS